MSDEFGYQTMNAALERLEECGFERGLAFANHGPMGAEAMIALGAPEELVRDWTESYRTEIPHHPDPDPQSSIDRADENDWRAALGDFGRATDWVQFFQRELDERPWQEVIALWWPRLLPGAFAGLTHGLIRTAHAIRSYSSTDSPSELQREELARGLAYWAARYSVTHGVTILLPTSDLQWGQATVQEAIARIPRPPGGINGRIPPPLAVQRFQQISPSATFRAAVTSIARPQDVGTALSELTGAFAGVFLARQEGLPGTMAHMVTAPAATRLALPYLPEEVHLATYSVVWNLAALLTATFATSSAGEEAGQVYEADLPSREQLIGNALDNGAEHAIKLTEACLREYDLNPDVRYLHAAAEGEKRMRGNPARDGLGGRSRRPRKSREGK